MWTKTDSRITIVTENSKPGISKYFLFGVSTLILTLCFAFAAVVYAKYGSLDVGLPFFIFVGMGAIALYAGFNQKNINPRQYAFIDSAQEKIGFSKSQKGPFFELYFSEIRGIRLVQDGYFSNHMKDSIGSNNFTKQNFQIFLVQKNGSVFWIDSYNSAEQATNCALTLYEYIQVPVENLMNDTEFDLTTKNYLKEPDNNRGTQGSIHLNPNVLTFKKVTSRSEKMGTYLLFAVIGFIPFAVINDSSRLSDYILSGFFFLIAIFFYVAYLISKRKYFIHVSSQKITVNIQYRPEGKKVTTSVEIPQSKLTAIQVHRLEKGNYLFAIRAKDLDLNVAKDLLLKAGLFRRTAIDENDDQLICLWEVPANKNDLDDLSLQNLYFIKNWITKQLK